jgi:hypothetical protein
MPLRTTALRDAIEGGEKGNWVESTLGTRGWYHQTRSECEGNGCEGISERVLGTAIGTAKDWHIPAVTMTVQRQHPTAPEGLSFYLCQDLKSPLFGVLLYIGLAFCL